MRRRLFGALGTSLACLFACNFVATRQLANAFNEGVLDSQNDPTYSRSQRATDTVLWRMRDELGEAYFGQGSSPTEREARVVAWMKALEAAAPKFMETSLRAYFSGDASMEMPTAEDDDGGGLDKRAPASQQKIQDALAQHAPGIVPPATPMCDGTTPNPKSIEALADYVRFRVALQKAVDVIAKLVDERFATMPEIVTGAERAFKDTATYLGDRTWKRDLDHHVTGLVVKGGAATGVFSSGVVWVALNVVDQCIRSGKCDPKHAGFALASGTSTGATVVGATDIFHTNIADGAKRATALDHYLNWYLCSSMNDLYCVRNGSAFDLARGEGAHGKDVQDSMLDFDGLAAKIEDNYHCPEMTNGMELILNTVDFRTGRLYSLSDQDPATLGGPWDVAKAIVSSAALPFIVRPTYHLPVDPLADAGNFAYLDGGIRSELPLLALVRRGVERLLVVSSGASITDDDKELPNSLGMAIRYIDISTGGVTEAEIDHAQTRVEASRLAEYEYCTSLLRHDTMSAVAGGRPALCNGTCDIDYLCSGDFKRVCTRDKAHFHPLQDNEQIVKHTFQMTNVWRNEDRIPGLPGYAFNPVEQRRLMMAGAEAAREKCMQIASTLGIDVGDRPGEVDKDTLYKWCTPRLPSTNEQCPARADAKASKDAPDCRAHSRGPEANPDAGSTQVCARGR